MLILLILSVSSLIHEQCTPEGCKANNKVAAVENNKLGLETADEQ